MTTHKLMVQYRNKMEYRSASQNGNIASGTLSFSKAQSPPGQVWHPSKKVWKETKYSTSYIKETAYHNRRYGKRYSHKRGSKYTVRKSTHINHNGGKKYLKPGDKIAINAGQGNAKSMGSNYIRVDGYYRWGIFHELNGGWVYNKIRQSSRNYHINFS